jgi:hypothetical protein
MSYYIKRIIARHGGTWEAEAGSLQVQGQPGLTNETYPKKKRKEKQRESRG